MTLETIFSICFLSLIGLLFVFVVVREILQQSNLIKKEQEYKLREEIEDKKLRDIATRLIRESVNKISEYRTDVRISIGYGSDVQIRTITGIRNFLHYDSLNFETLLQAAEQYLISFSDCSPAVASRIATKHPCPLLASDLDRINSASPVIFRYSKDALIIYSLKSLKTFIISYAYY